MDLIARNFPVLEPPVRHEPREKYIARHVEAIGMNYRWNADAVIQHRSSLPQGEWDGQGSPHVLTVRHEAIDGYGVADTMDTLNFWSPRLGGSLLAAVQDATHIIRVWGPNESLAYMFMWGEEKEWWADMLHQVWSEHRRENEPEPAPSERGHTRYPVTRAQIREYIQHNHIITPREFRRQAGRATCNAAAYPLSHEQLWQFARDPHTTPEHAAALTNFLTVLEELRGVNARLEARRDANAYLFMPDADTYPHCSVWFDPHDSRNSVVAEGFDDFMEYVMNSGDESSLNYATAVELDSDLTDVLGDLTRLAALHADLCGQLSRWPRGGVTPAMRLAVRHLRPPPRGAPRETSLF